MQGQKVRELQLQSDCFLGFAQLELHVCDYHGLTCRELNVFPSRGRPQLLESYNTHPDPT